MKNKYLVGSFLLGTLLQVIVVLIPAVAEIFKLVPLTMTQWMFVFGISFLPIVIMEIQKKLNELKFGKRIYETEEKSCHTLQDSKQAM